MKNLLLLFVFAFILSSCSNDDDSDSLPAATTIGANTVGCLVNGKVFLPHQEGISPSVNCFYQFVDGEFYFSMSFSDNRGTSNKTVNVFTKKVELQIGQKYLLNQPDGTIQGGGGEYRTSQSNQYNTNTIQTGELKITRVDLSNSIISGVFSFDAINSDGEIVQIREGRFDWTY